MLNYPFAFKQFIFAEKTDKVMVVKNRKNNFKMSFKNADKLFNQFGVIYGWK